jgi:hypothetical protein
MKVTQESKKDEDGNIYLIDTNYMKFEAHKIKIELENGTKFSITETDGIIELETIEENHE